MTKYAGPTNASNSITLSVKLKNEVGSLAKVTTAISDSGGNIGAIDIVAMDSGTLVREITVNTAGPEHRKEITEAVDALEGIELLNVTDRTFKLHVGGKIETKSSFPVMSRDNLAMAYTPGVARVCEAIHKNKELAHKLTIKSNTVAIISDGTAVLGLGDIGPEAAMPVMEGKAMLFKDFGGVDAFPICLDTKDTEDIIKTIKHLAPGFGGINLEDISAPRCFEIERRLKEDLNIPVFHDDQHGTAVVLTAGIINALKLVNKQKEAVRVIVSGVGAAGTACTQMLLKLGVKNIIGFDRKGALGAFRDDLNDAKREYAEATNPEGFRGSLKEGMVGADIFIGVSGPNLIDVSHLKTMNNDPIVFAMSNPTPEIMPESAWPHVAVMATGRSDYPNQINNVLCFPGIFKGALSCQASDINEEMKVAASKAIAETIGDHHLSAEYIIPSVFNKDVVPRVAEAVELAARKTGVARLS